MLSYNVLNSWVEKMMKKNLPVKIKTSNITSLSTKDINKLKAGDIVLKKTGNQKHAYIVSYKEENQGICLTYTDASIIETVSYDYNPTTKTWVYNSTDKTVIQKELTAGDNITITDAGVISATDTTYTAGTGIIIEDNTITATAAQLYEHNIQLIDHLVDYLGNFHCIIISTKSTTYTKSEIETLFATYYNSAQFPKSGIGRYRPTSSSPFEIEYLIYRNNNKWYFYDDVTDSSTELSYGITQITDNIRPL